jgi:hypothetical protein
VHACAWHLRRRAARSEGGRLRALLPPPLLRRRRRRAAQAGVAAIAHPGGSIRDQDAVDCCNKYGVAIVTTGVRHFKH